MTVKQAIAVVALSMSLGWSNCVYALDPSLDISQYAHTAWKINEGFTKGAIQQMAQTPDGYLWLGTEYGLFRFDGAHTVRWEPPPGEHLPDEDIRGLIAGRDGTLWIGTGEGLASWKNGKLTTYPELYDYDVYTLLEDHEGTAWAGGIYWEDPNKAGKLCAIHSGKIQCYGSDGRFGIGVTALQEDSEGRLWVGAATGIWRWKPGPPLLIPVFGEEVAGSSHPMRFFSLNGMVKGDRGSLIVAENQIAKDQSVFQLSDGKINAYPFPSPPPSLTEVTLLRDSQGSLWIGGRDAGLVHLHQGKMDVYTQADGLSGNWVLSIFEDREGSIWVATHNGLDRFHENTIPTIGVKQGLSSADVHCVLAAKDGSVWLGSSNGLNRWKDGQITVYRAPTAGKSRNSPASPTSAGGHEVIANGLQDNDITSLYQDHQDRIWLTTPGTLAYFANDRFIPVREGSLNPASPVVSDSAGNLWMADTVRGLIGLQRGKQVEDVSWAKLGIQGSFSNPLVADPVHGGVWVGSWNGGVVYFKDGRVRESYGTNSGLGEGRVNSLQFDNSGALWAATDNGLSRIQNGHLLALTRKNGLPCDATFDLQEDKAHSFWVFGACGLMRMARSEVDAWVANPKQSIHATVFDNSDGVISHPGIIPPAPRSARSADGRLWFLPLAGALVVDPSHLPRNEIPPPVHVERILVNGHAFAATQGLRLPPLVRDLMIEYTALSLVAPEKVRFRFKLEGQDLEWREVVNDRRVQYSNLPPGTYRFRVIACNNSGVWNEQGEFLDFVIPPAWFQTVWFRMAACAFLLLMIWAAFYWRVRSIKHRNRELAAVNSELEKSQCDLRRKESVLRRLNRELRAISDCNQVLVRARDEQALLGEICRIVCYKADYRMAWVGYIEHDEAKTVRAVSSAGVDAGYVEAARITWADTERGRGPIGTSIRTGNTVVVQDIATDLQIIPWRESAFERGYRACIALPLKDESGAVFGVFSIYSAEPHAFTSEEIRLLEELSGDLAFGIMVLRGRIERRQAEDEIRQLNAELEERVRQRTAQLEAANKELESFSYSVSHDLRAPLRHISGFSNVLMEEYREQLPEEAQDYLDRVAKGAQRMGTLIDGLLNFSRLGRQQIGCRRVDLNEVVKAVIEELSPDWSHRAVEWKIGPLPTVQGEPTLLGQVFQNLIANALKFSRNRNPAIIEIGATLQDGTHLLFVRDNGAGFDMKYADKLFGVFQRLHSAEEFEGTGIGLATTRRIVARHGGKIWAEAEVDKGATFFFTCPLQ